jgi:hypothetical protein
LREAWKMSDRVSPSREFKNIFSYLFRHEADVRTAIPVAGVMRMGWGWSFIIDDFFRLFSEYAMIDPETGQLDLTEETEERVRMDLASDDEERRRRATTFVRWLTVLEKQLPLLLNMSPRSHEIAAALVRSVTLPQVRYTVTEASQYRPPFWGAPLEIVSGPPRSPPPEEGGGGGGSGGGEKWPKPPRIFRGGGEG